MKMIALALATIVPVLVGLRPEHKNPIDPLHAAPTEQSPQGQSGKQNIRSVTVVFLRHAEALPRTKHNQNPVLATAGKERAALVAKTLRAAGITRIFATELVRTQETAAPLAKVLGLPIERYAAAKPKQFADRLRKLKSGEVAFVVGHSNTVPAMVKALGGTLKNLTKRGFLHETEHDRMIVQVLCGSQPDTALAALPTLDLRLGN